MNTTWHSMINSNTYMNSITTTSLHACIKYPHQLVEIEQCYLGTDEVNVSTLSSAAKNPSNDNIVFFSDPTDIAEADHE